MYYHVIALDAEGHEVGRYESGPNKSTANKEAKASLKGDKEWQNAGMIRVTVMDDNGICHYDHKLPATRPRAGTHHFRSMRDAGRYYSATYEEIQAKVVAGEIAIGEPKLARGQRLSMDSDGRYWIEG